MKKIKRYKREAYDYFRRLRRKKKYFLVPVHFMKKNNKLYRKLKFSYLKTDEFTLAASKIQILNTENILKRLMSTIFPNRKRIKKRFDYNFQLYPKKYKYKIGKKMLSYYQIIRCICDGTKYKK